MSDDDIARLEVELAACRAQMLALDAERRELIKGLPRGQPWRCPCGELIYSWDAATERLHGEHIFVASLD